MELLKVAGAAATGVLGWLGRGVQERNKDRRDDDRAHESKVNNQLSHEAKNLLKNFNNLKQRDSGYRYAVPTNGEIRHDSTVWYQKMLNDSELLLDFLNSESAWINSKTEHQARLFIQAIKEHALCKKAERGKEPISEEEVHKASEKVLREYNKFQVHFKAWRRKWL